MRIINFAKRNFKEITRDPLSIVFAILLPMFLLIIFQQFKIPSEVYNIEIFTPGIIIFGFAFITMFTATLVSKDRSTSLLTRLGASPMKSSDYILGYTFAILPIIIIQNVLFFLVAVILGLPFGINIILTILVSILISVLFIALGILIGSVTTENGSAGVGSVVVQLVAFTSGMYFSADMLGDFFGFLCKVLPFSSAVDITREVLNNNGASLTNAVIIFVVYTIISIVAAIIVFKKKMISDNK